MLSVAVGVAIGVTVGMLRHILGWPLVIPLCPPRAAKCLTATRRQKGTDFNAPDGAVLILVDVLFQTTLVNIR